MFIIPMQVLLVLIACLRCLLFVLCWLLASRKNAKQTLMMLFFKKLERENYYPNELYMIQLHRRTLTMAWFNQSSLHHTAHASHSTHTAHATHTTAASTRLLRLICDHGLGSHQ
jgi:hypothetical protein